MNHFLTIIMYLNIMIKNILYYDTVWAYIITIWCLASDNI